MPSEPSSSPKGSMKHQEGGAYFVGLLQHDAGQKFGKNAGMKGEVLWAIATNCTGERFRYVAGIYHGSQSSFHSFTGQYRQ